jgi:hypothetical protein
MTVLDSQGLGHLIKSVGPTDEQRQTFGRTFLGSLLGQATILVGMVLIYVAALVLLSKYGLDELKKLYDAVGWLAFWPIITAPLVVILLFSMLPTAWRALRERRLKATVIGGDVQFKPGYFRLHPYGAADRETFKRLDGADDTMLGWLKSADKSLLYLSGASGVGKSSVLAAKALPQLRDSGWTVVETRLFGNPIQRLRAALLAADSRLAKKTSAELPLQELLKKAVEPRSKKQDAPLLLVIDQFEEFLILHSEEERRAFGALLDDLVKNPIDGLRILLVFRSDYQPLVFKLGLPPLVAGQNWYALPPYDRGEATKFLQSGGRELSPQAIDKLFRGLDRIEDAPGVYRPITLNMVGFVLERMGSTLEGDPGRLIQSYLTACLTTSASRDFAKPLLAQMITDAGTKEPRTEEELAKLTGFDQWQVKATLADLARHGLVRRLEAATAVWEIAHDFLARIIGQLIGRLRPTVFQRTRPLVAPLVLMGWIALAVLALPYWMTMQERTAEQVLRKSGVMFAEARGGGIAVVFPELSNDSLIKAKPYLQKIAPRELLFQDAKEENRFERMLEVLSGRTSWGTSLEPLEGLTTLRILNLRNATYVTSLEPLKGLTNLRSLSLANAISINSLEPLKGLTNLETLHLTGAWDITSLEPLRGLTHLTELDLTGPRGITSLEPLRELTNLFALSLHATSIRNLMPLDDLTSLRSLQLIEANASGITSLEPVRGLTYLRSLLLSDPIDITSLDPLKGLTRLERLHIRGRGVTGVTSLEPLKGLRRLEELELYGATDITSLEPLKELTNLRSLRLYGARMITSLEPLRALTNLRSLGLEDAADITSLEPLKELSNLETLNLNGATGITSLEPLRERNIRIDGASSQLRATMQ